MNILDRIKELYPQFTRKQKNIADYMTTNPGGAISGKSGREAALGA